MSEADKAKLRDVKNCPYDSCEECGTQFCPAKTNMTYDEMFANEEWKASY